MSGVLDFLNERKAYFNNMREKDPQQYVKTLSSSTDKLARQVGVGNDTSNKVLGAIRSQSDEMQNRMRQQGETDRRKHHENRVMGERTVAQVKTLGYDLGNDIHSMQSNLASLLKDSIAVLKKIERGVKMVGQEPLFDVRDILDLRRGGRRGGARRRRNRARAARAARAGARTPPPLPRSGPPPLPKPGPTGVLGRVTGSVRSAGSRALGWFRGPGGSAAAGGAEAGVARSVTSGLGVSALRKAGTVGAIAAGGYGAYEALKDDTKTSDEKAKAVAGVAGGTAGALALGAGGAKLGAVIGTAILPGIGTAIGGAIGGLGGGALGYFGGEKIITEGIDKLNAAIDSSGIGEHIGRATAIAISPFSAEARESLVSDWKNNILPKWQATMTPLKDTLNSWGDKLSGFGEKIAGWKDALSAQFDKLPEGVKDALGTAGQAAGAAFTGLATPVRAAMGVARSVARRVEASGDTGRAVMGGVRTARDAVASVLPAGMAGALGIVSAKYESGGRGVHTVSTGAGDHGGVSYGKYQLATNNGSMSKFLASAQGSQYAAQFAGLRAGSAEFSAKYKQIAASDGANFEKAQHDYIVASHYDPLARKIARDTGLDVNSRSKAVQEAVMSTAVQYGGGSSVFSRAMSGLDLKTATDAQIVNALQDYKAANVGTHFKSSNERVRASVARRIENERRDLLALTGATGENAARPATGGTAKDVSTSVASGAGSSASPTASVQRTAIQSPVTPVNPGTPKESTPVAVVSQPGTAGAAEKTSGATAGIRRPSVGSGPINIDDIPAFLPDPSMASVLFGRV